MKRPFLLLMLMLSASILRGQTVINLQPDGNNRRFTAFVNGVGVKAYYTEETWNVSISPTTFRFLNENGYLSYSDVKGNATLRIGGEDVPAMTLVIKSLRVGDLVIKDMPAALIRTQTAPMLVGPSAFYEFGAVELDGDRLLIGDEPSVAGDGVQNPTDSLRRLAQQYLEDEAYDKAAESFGKLYSDGKLSMFTFCQYCLTLALADRYADNISKSKEWLGKYAGISQVSDYWIYDSMGNSAFALEKWSDADSYYAEAFRSECELYNTSEASILAGDFHDETLGRTLFMRSKAQAHLKNLRASEHWCLLAAKLGYAPAIEFCEKYGIN